MRKVADSPNENHDNNNNDLPTASTPKRQKRGPGLSTIHEVNEHGSNGDVTPSKRMRNTPKKVDRNDTLNASGLKTPTHKTKARSLFTTPKKDPTATPSRVRNADRSAKRKSARILLEQDEEDTWDGADKLAEEILGDDNSTKTNCVIETTEKDGQAAETTAPPVKRRAGRPKGAKNKRSPTPEGDIPPHERYFFQNRPGPPNTSNNNLNKVSLLAHDEYFELLGRYNDPFSEEKELLLNIHRRSFPQWNFEFYENFNICLYGYGSKRGLVQKFADWLYVQSESRRPIIIVNGYAPNTSVKAILTAIATTVCGEDVPSKIGGTPSEALEFLQSALQSRKTPITILINSIDAPPLRRLVHQAQLARLAALPNVNLLATVDTPNFLTMWDVSLRDQFNFVFHDCTTFAPLDVEMNVVDEVNNLLGRKGRRVGGRDGVAFVLKSLPENARSLYRLLLTEILTLQYSDGNGGFSEDEDGQPQMQTQKTGRREEPGIEFKMLYQKAAEEFIASSEMMFRTLLKEFHDHQMVTSRMDASGTETLSVPLSREEMEGVLEDLVLS
ncbi:origin recognition complex subunit 2, putative [Talaromyces stipitatus ATCC 10500]|uniref:Origin recognition complex subunit 2 n=1 Tax=Talaromyces stipitatus (strain ATCC 10500 / CBS 375.48 / QM 6759 / NRRL 1006) TaxID=441959 RepID=B8M9V8_TALSN|nr:origin recognition complex subunit 2, putative [Talaromyces stipitatus ATCC 10500]EED18110.1 origin recognition complex subunit 2, putative [Talaromyces stipitatus ATCC 10500]